MKKDLRNTFGLIASMGLAVVCLSVLPAYSMDGINPSVEEGTVATEEATTIKDGKAVLALEDLKTLLGASARDPSDQSRTLRLDQDDPSESGPHFKINLRHSERKALTSKLSSLQIERNRLKGKLSTTAAVKKKELREKRRSIQASRLNSNTNSDVKLGVSLYENFILESNLDAEIEKNLAEFDTEHAVTLDYVQVGSEKFVNAIYLGAAKVWSTDETRHLARK